MSQVRTDAERGFITVATGDYFHYLAENLIMSYRLFSKNDIPFYVITDMGGADRLMPLFDGVIVDDKPTFSFMDKMRILEKTVFEQTIFIDADANITGDISFLFNEFDALGSDISVIGEYRESPPHLWNQKASERFDAHRQLAFNGGVYYFKRTLHCNECMKFIAEELMHHYDDYGLVRFRNNSMGDEPLYGLMIAAQKMEPLQSRREIMMLAQDMQTFSWDLEKRKCSFIWYGKRVYPLIAHYGTGNTHSIQYTSANIRIKCMYNGEPHVIMNLKILAFYIEEWKKKIVTNIKRILKAVLPRKTVVSLKRLFHD